MPEEDLVNRYLWDSSGEPDPEVQRLEKSLAQFRHKGEPPAFPVTIWAGEKVSSFGFLQLLWPRRLAAVAAIAVIAVATSFLISRPAPPTAPRPGWEVARLEGAPTINARSIQSQKGKLEVGQLLVTNASSRATITVAEIGEIQVDPGTRVRLLQTMRDRKRISLEEGTIHAAIWAPPGEFVVDTPSAVAVDLGCGYTLQVFIQTAATPSSPPALFAQPIAMSAPALLISKTHPNLSAMRLANWISLHSLQNRVLPLCKLSFHKHAKTTHSHSGIFSLALKAPTAKKSSIALQSWSRHPMALRAKAFSASINTSWTSGGTRSASATFPSGASGSNRPIAPFPQTRSFFRRKKPCSNKLVNTSPAPAVFQTECKFFCRRF